MFYKLFIAIAAITIVFNKNLFCQSVEAILIKPSNKIVLSEKKFIINGVISAGVSADESKLAFISRDLLSIYQYELKTGKLVSHFNSYPGLNKFMIEKPRYRMDSARALYDYATNKICQMHGIDTNNIQNQLVALSYDGNDIIVASIARCYGKHRTDSSKRPLLQNMTCYYQFDKKLKIKFGTPLETYNYDWPDAGGIIKLEEDKLVFPVRNFSDVKSGYPGFSAFDKNGKRLELVSELPKDYQSSGFAYFLAAGPKFCKVGGKVFWTTDADYKIRNLFKDEGFEIIGFDTTNKFAWAEYGAKLKQRKNGNILTLDTNKKIRLNFMLRAYVKNIENWADTLIAVHVKNDKRDYAQFYNIDGKLTNFFELKPIEGYEIVSALFLPKSNQVVAICSNENEYILTNYNLNLEK
jgi:hypothetical protein